MIHSKFPFVRQIMHENTIFGTYVQGSKNKKKRRKRRQIYLIINKQKIQTVNAILSRAFNAKLIFTRVNVSALGVTMVIFFSFFYLFWYILRPSLCMFCHLNRINNQIIFLFFFFVFLLKSQRQYFHIGYLKILLHYLHCMRFYLFCFVGIEIIEGILKIKKKKKTREMCFFGEIVYLNHNLNVCQYHKRKISFITVVKKKQIPEQNVWHYKPHFVSIRRHLIFNFGKNKNYILLCV